MLGTWQKGCEYPQVSPPAPPTNSPSQVRPFTGKKKSHQWLVDQVPVCPGPASAPLGPDSTRDSTNTRGRTSCSRRTRCTRTYLSESQKCVQGLQGKKSETTRKARLSVALVRMVSLLAHAKPNRNFRWESPHAASTCGRGNPTWMCSVCMPSLHVKHV